MQYYYNHKSFFLDNVKKNAKINQLFRKQFNNKSFHMNQSNQKPDNIVTLESKIAYLEYNMENLNSEILDLRQTVDKQKIIINFLVEKLKGIQGSNIADRSEETPPPHY